MYDSGRYFVLTGNLWQFRSRIQERTEQIADLHARLFGRAPAETPVAEGFDPGLAAGDVQGSMETLTTGDFFHPLSDDELLLRAASARNGEKFLRLWRGDLSAYGGNHSEADLALCSLLLYWTRGDRDQADRLFRQSNLVRDKWTKREDYRKRTFDQAVVRNLPLEDTRPVIVEVVKPTGWL